MLVGDLSSPMLLAGVLMPSPPCTDLHLPVSGVRLCRPESPDLVDMSSGEVMEQDEAVSRQRLVLLGACAGLLPWLQ